MRMVRKVLDQTVSSPFGNSFLKEDKDEEEEFATPRSPYEITKQRTHVSG